jgi:DNA-binding NtrC family response regulator
MEYDYKGNVRELQNIIEHAFVLCRSGEIQLRHLPPYLRNEPAQGAIRTEGMTLKSSEKRLIAEALRKHNGNRALAARDLGINPSTLYRKIRDLRIEFPRRDGRSEE